MSLKLAGHLFTGPFTIDTTEVRANQIPVVYAVIAKGGQAWAPAFRVVDVQASPDQGVRFADHPSRRGWVAKADETTAIYLHYMPRSEFSAADREQMAQELRAKYQPPRGFV
jgi:hypothetical protein